jgi:hypothetical protein
MPPEHPRLQKNIGSIRIDIDIDKIEYCISFKHYRRHGRSGAKLLNSYQKDFSVFYLNDSSK